MKYFKYLGIVAIALFSFYYTDKVAGYVLEKNSLYQTIEEKSKNYEIESVSAVIDGEYITPGINGLSVNIKDSYYNMKSKEVFNEYYLVYEKSYPTISTIDNKDKIINKGNSNKNSISLIVEYDENIIDYLKSYNISVLVDLDTFNKNASYEQINNDNRNYHKLDKLFRKNGIDSEIFVTNGSDKKNNKFNVLPNKELNNQSLLKLKNNINSGDIIIIRKNTKLENIELLLKEIKFKDYSINYLSKHISEERD